MTSGKRWFFSTIGRLMVAVSGFLLLLFVANVRSRLYYNGPNYSFLIWPFLYALLAGIGVMKLKKWGVLLLFLPSIVMLAELGVIREMESVPLGILCINFACVLLLAAVPAIMLRSWSDLRW